MKRQNNFLISTACTVSFLAGVVLFSGCGATAMPSLTEEQENQIVKYAADAVMRHVNTYNNRLADLSLYEEKEEKPQETKEPASAMDPTVETTVIDKSEEPASYNLAQVLLPEGFSMEYSGYEVTDSYPQTEEMAFVIDASQNKKLLVLSFTVTNNGTESVDIDINGRKPYCVLRINDTDKYFIQTTLLNDDITTYHGTMEAGAAVQLVMIAEIPEEKADSIETLKLSVTAGDRTTVTELQ